MISDHRAAQEQDENECRNGQDSERHFSFARGGFMPIENRKHPKEENGKNDPPHGGCPAGVEIGDIAC
jgi:hypothetical protein